jgi:hypothetical protein
MSEDRLQQLIEKRDGPGLSDDEADELGNLMAEKEGRPYGGKQARAEAESNEDSADDEARRDKAPSSFDVEEMERETEIEER